MKKKFNNDEINKILISNPPIYASGKYYAEMAKKFKINKQDVKNRCIKLGLIEIRIKKLQHLKKIVELQWILLKVLYFNNKK